MDSGASDKTMVQKTFKLVFSETDIRRISINSSSWDSFIAQLQKQYPTEFHPELRIQYVDNEGDRCTLSSKQEWDSMMDLFGDQPTIKLYISEGVHAGRYFKDGPPPQVHDLYLKTGPGPDSKLLKINREDESSSIAIAVPQCLKRLFPSGQILPYNLPSWLQPHVKVTKVPGSETDVYMDIDISSLFDELHRQALKRIGPNKKPKALERAKAFLESMLAIVPKHPVALYNLACAEALLGRGEAAINALKEAVAAGYSNVTHMISDADLASLHRHVEFNSLVEQMKAGFEMTKAGFENGLEKTKAGFENGLEMTKAGFEKTRASVTAYAASLREQQQQQQPAEQPVEEEKKEEEEVQLEPVPDSESESEPYVVIEKQQLQQPQEEEKKVEQPVEVKQPEPVVVEEKKVEQPVEEPAPRRIKPEFVAPEGFKWPEQLRVMVDMGFDGSLSMQKLQKRKGNLDRAVNDMLLS